MHSALRRRLPVFLCRAALWCAGVLLGTAALAGPVTAQPALPDSSWQSMVNASAQDGPVVLTLDQAIRIALQENYDVRDADLTMRNADAQVREAWGQVLPQVDATGSYTRNLKQANPFAGSDISSIFGGGAQAEWVAFNEEQRLDGDPATDPIPFAAFQARQRQALEEAGVQLGGGSNPFGVDNEFNAGLQITQTLYSGSAFAAISGAAQFKEVQRLNRTRQVQMTANGVYEAYYQALLAQEQVRVVQERLDRTKETLQEISTQVRQGVVPKYQRLSAEVELSNTRTELIQTRNSAELALDNLKNTMGIPVDTPVRLEGVLEASGTDRFMTASMTRLVDRALEQRPDLRQAQLNVELEQIQKRTTRAQYLPTVEAVANFNYTGRVPDDRTLVNTTNPDDPTDPFFYERQTRDFFSTSYWNPSISVGLNLRWNLFNGFQTTARMQQREISIQQAELQRERLRRGVELEVKRALRDLQNARERIQSQQANVDRAQVNYDYTLQRVEEGVSNQLELREASDQLDQSRLNVAQAVFDYLVARSDLETALGQPLTPASSTYQTTSLE